MGTSSSFYGPVLFSPVVPPTGRWVSAAQRGDKTYLVDAKFSMWKDTGAHLYGNYKYGAHKYGPDDTVSTATLISAEYSTDGGLTWNTASPQTYDRKHSAVNPLSFTALETEFDFVWNAFWDLPDDFEGSVLFRVTISGSTIVLTSDPFWVSTVVGTVQSVAKKPVTAFKIDDYLGEGPVAPWRRGPQDFMMARGKDLVASAIRQILATKAATNRWGGELEWDPGFGSLFWTLKHDRGDETTAELAAGFAELALEIEPRVIITGARVEYQEQPGGARAMFIYVTYKLIRGNMPDNQVFQPVPDQVKIEV